jgi:hypothetical protein
MSRFATLVWLEVYTRRRRIAALVLFGALYLVGAIVMRAIGTGDHGIVDPDKLMQVGGYSLLSAILLTGWSIGRYPLVIAMVLLAGIVSRDIKSGYARLYAVTRVRLLALYASRLAILMLLAFVISALLLPAFDFIILGKLSGPQVYVLVAAYILVFGTLTALFSVITRADAWVTLFVWMTGMVWHGMLRGGMLNRVPAALTQLVSVVLPPLGALNTIENAFANNQAIPWGAFLYVAMYSVLMLLLAGLALSRREI